MLKIHAEPCVHVSGKSVLNIPLFLASWYMFMRAVFVMKIHAEGGRYIGRALRSNTSLVSLNLRLNRLTDEGGRMLVEGLHDNPTLACLNLRYARGDPTLHQCGKRSGQGWAKTWNKQNPVPCTSAVKLRAQQHGKVDDILEGATLRNSPSSSGNTSFAATVTPMT